MLRGLLLLLALLLLRGRQLPQLLPSSRRLCTALGRRSLGGQLWPLLLRWQPPWLLPLLLLLAQARGASSWLPIAKPFSRRLAGLPGLVACCGCLLQPPLLRPLKAVPETPVVLVGRGWHALTGQLSGSVPQPAHRGGSGS